MHGQILEEAICSDIHIQANCSTGTCTVFQIVYPEDFPAIQILPLDLEPDTSFANVENRLQMLIMNEKSRSMEKVLAQKSVEDRTPPETGLWREHL